MTGTVDRPEVAKAFAIVALASSVVSSAAAKYSTAGWIGFFFAPLYAALLVVHLVLNQRAVRIDRARLLYLSGSSSVALFTAFMLQLDYGDGYSWLTYGAVLFGAGEARAQPPTWFPGSLGMNVLLFVPWLALAVAFGRKAKREVVAV